MHLQKVTRIQAIQIADELERSSEYMKYYDRAAHEIKPEMTSQNYDLIQSDLSIKERLDKRLSEIKVHNRADVKHLGQWVITMPADLDSTKQEQFFESVCKFFEKEYGEKNVIYAVVHLDETSPHMHLGAVPVALNNKGQEHLSAKKVFTRTRLQTVHADCQTFCEERLGCDVNLLNGASLGVEGVKEYKKAKELVKEIKVLETEVAELRQERTHLQKEVKALTNERNAIEKEIEEKKGFLNRVKNFLIGHPNFLEMFLHWLNPEIEKKERQRCAQMYEKHLDELRNPSRGFDR